MPNTETSFIQHLEELRRRIIWCIVFIIIASIISYNFTDKIICHIAKPVGKLVFIQPIEAFLAYLKLSIFCGIFISSPVVLYHLFAFIVPGLKHTERHYIFLFLPLGVILFFCGAGFAYFVMIPFCVKFLISYSTPWLVPMISVGGYVSFFCMFILIFGAVFQLPALVLFLTKLGIVSPASLRKNRKYVILGIFIVAAIFTPPDVFSQIIMAIPLIVLYELSIFLSFFARRKKQIF